MTNQQSLMRDDEDIHQINSGKYMLMQKKKGFRLSQESILLAQSLLRLKVRKAIDLGTGCGIIPLMLTELPQIEEIHGIEIQPELVDLARRNVELNGLTKLIRISQLDVRSVKDIFVAGSFDLVVANPPFRTTARGTKAKNKIRNGATQEVYLALRELVASTHYLLKHRGVAAFVYAPDRLGEFMETMSAGRVEPKTMTFIHHHPSINASAVIVHGKANASSGLEIAPPIILNNLPGSGSDCR